MHYVATLEEQPNVTVSVIPEIPMNNEMLSHLVVMVKLLQHISLLRLAPTMQCIGLVLLYTHNVCDLCL